MGIIMPMVCCMFCSVCIIKLDTGSRQNPGVVWTKVQALISENAEYDAIIYTLGLLLDKIAAHGLPRLKLEVEQ